MVVKLMELGIMQVQVVVMSANMGCSHCRQRVTKVVTKMNGKDLIDVYMLLPPKFP
jgi:copper chaperone CopZ